MRSKDLDENKLNTEGNRVLIRKSKVVNQRLSNVLQLRGHTTYSKLKRD